MYDFYEFARGTTKSIKSKSEDVPGMNDVDDRSTRFITSTKVFRVFNGVDFKNKLSFAFTIHLDP